MLVLLCVLSFYHVNPSARPESSEAVDRPIPAHSDVLTANLSSSPHLSSELSFCMLFNICAITIHPSDVFLTSEPRLEGTSHRSRRTLRKHSGVYIPSCFHERPDAKTFPEACAFDLEISKRDRAFAVCYAARSLVLPLPTRFPWYVLENISPLHRLTFGFRRMSLSRMVLQVQLLRETH